MTSVDVSLKKKHNRQNVTKEKNHIRKTMTISTLSWSWDFKIRLLVELMFP